MNWLRMAAAAGCAALLAGCGAPALPWTAGRGETASAESPSDAGLITVGFAQVGEESDWRRANSVSIEDAFSTKSGYRLLFDDGQNDPDNQIVAIRNFIQQEVDYIVLEPIIEDGWDTVLKEAKEAGIPVIVADRQIRVQDDSLYAAWVGSDCLLEGRMACEWLHAWCAAKGIPDESLKIVNLQGTLGSTPQIGRDGALKESCSAYGWELLAQTRGEFTQAKGREAMEEMLAAYPSLNVVYCDNDNEAYGAIDAILKAGRTPGTDLAGGDILVISFDAAKKALTYVKNGQIAVDGECNPLHGPRIRSIIEKLEEGGEVSKTQYVEEGLFAADSTVPSVTADGITRDVTVVTQRVIDDRSY